MNSTEYTELKALILALHSKVDRLTGGSTQAASAHAVGEVADAAELDSQWGNPQIRKDPPRWSGESFAGCRFSECSPEYLDTVASFNDWRADQDDKAGAVDAKGRPKSYFARKDAARARGWAARIRASQPASPSPHARPAGHTSSAASRQPYQARPAQNAEADFVDDVPF